jgi:hypothetical protein
MKTLVTGMIPKNDRERELMEFWYNKGYAEAELMAVVAKDKRKVSIVVTDKKKRKVLRTL